MPDPALIVQQVRAFQAKLLAKEETQFGSMARTWLGVERSLEGQMSALALEIEAARAVGKIVTLEQIRKMDRYQRLLRETQREVGKYEKYAGELISERQKDLIRAGWANAVEAVRTARPNTWREFIGTTPIKAVENMVGLTSDGSPLATLLAAASGDSIDGVNRALINAMAQGWNPNKTAREMANGLAGGLDRSLLIARTEQLRAYRESSRTAYQTSGIVKRYKRIASKSDRTCIACLFADGEIYEVETDFEEHPAGRCGLVPIVDGVAEPQWETGKEWFTKQDESRQQEMMGMPAWEAWQNGSITLDDLVSRHEDPVWGSYLMPTPNKDLPGVGSATGKAPAGNISGNIAIESNGPSGAPVSKAINLTKVKDKNVKNQADLILGEIDKVHGDGQLPDLPVSVSTAKGRYGAFWHRGSRAEKITISKTGDHQALTMAHEIGHFLDHSAANVPWASAMATGENRAIIDAAKQTDWVKNIWARYAAVNNRSAADAYVIMIDRNYVNYLMGSREIYARAYAQYIATKSQNPVLLDQLKVLQSAKFSSQWSDEDFKPIARAFDELFKQKGWIK